MADPQQIADDLRNDFRGRLAFDPVRRGLYATDASPFEVTPLGVAFPVDVEDLSVLVRYCHEHAVPMVARGAGEELLEPTRIYAKACLALADETTVHAMAHVTGGGLAANLARVVPEEVSVTIDRGTWTPAPVFDLVRTVGSLSRSDIDATLNAGVGMVALLPAESVDTAVATLARFGIPAWAAGEVTLDRVQGGSVTLVGSHPA